MLKNFSDQIKSLRIIDEKQGYTAIEIYSSNYIKYSEELSELNSKLMFHLSSNDNNWEISKINLKTILQLLKSYSYNLQYQVMLQILTGVFSIYLVLQT